MDSRRLTLFPKTDTITSSESAPPAAGPRAAGFPPSGSTAKRKFQGTDSPIDLKLPKLARSTGNKVYTPIEEDIERFYKAIYIVDPDGPKPYCLVHVNTRHESENAHRVVMIRRYSDRAVVGTSRPNLNLINILEAFRTDGSIFVVFDRPGVPLSDIAISHSLPLEVRELRTISREVAPCSGMRIHS